MMKWNKKGEYEREEGKVFFVSAPEMFRKNVTSYKVSHSRWHSHGSTCVCVCVWGDMPLYVTEDCGRTRRMQWAINRVTNSAGESRGRDKLEGRKEARKAEIMQRMPN